MVAVRIPLESGGGFKYAAFNPVSLQIFAQEKIAKVAEAVLCRGLALRPCFGLV